MIDFYYDIASPYSYLAACRIDAEAAQAEVEVRWRPFLLGGVFRAVGNKPPATVPTRARYMLEDLKRWAVRGQVPFRFNPFFPNNSITVMRILTAVADDQSTQSALAKRFFKATWVDGKNIGDEAVIREVLGADVELLAHAKDQKIKDALRATTDGAVERGAL